MPRRGKIPPFPGRRAVPSPRESSPPQEALVVVHRCSSPEALVVKGLLESASLRPLLRTQLIQSVHPFTVGDQGEVTILVPQREAPRARLLLVRLVANPRAPARTERSRPGGAAGGESGRAPRRWSRLRPRRPAT